MRTVQLPSRPREDNPVIFLEISTSNHDPTVPKKSNVLGRLYFELRQDIAPLACENFLQLVLGGNYSGVSNNEKKRSIADNDNGNKLDCKNYGDYDYHLKGTLLHRIVKDVICQGRMSFSF